jgi:hypothetical protein
MWNSGFTGKYAHLFFEPPAMPSGRRGHEIWTNFFGEKGRQPELHFNYHPVNRPYVSKRTPHIHDYDEILAWSSNNAGDPDDFKAEIIFFLGTELEKYVITRPMLVYLPAGFSHGPMEITRVDKPFFQVAIACVNTKSEYQNPKSETNTKSEF